VCGKFPEIFGRDQPNLSDPCLVFLAPFPPLPDSVRQRGGCFPESLSVSATRHRKRTRTEMHYQHWIRASLRQHFPGSNTLSNSKCHRCNQIGPSNLVAFQRMFQMVYYCFIAQPDKPLLAESACRMDVWVLWPRRSAAGAGWARLSQYLAIIHPFSIEFS
jgi:hypothetical protein